MGFTFAKEDEKKIDGPVIGIDLGTTYSCVPSLYEKLEDKDHLDGHNLGFTDRQWINNLGPLESSHKGPFF